MHDLTISIFGSKILFEILNEIKVFSKYKVNFFDNFNKYTDEKNSGVNIFFLNNENLSFYKNIKDENFQVLTIYDNSISKKLLLSSAKHNLAIPFSIQELEKKIILTFSKSEFKRNSLIYLNDYVIDKNERKIKKHNLELQLSEKEIDFLVLFSKNKGPITRHLVLKNVWNYASSSETHTVETHIHRLRKKILEKFNDNNFIKNNNKGYYI
jgi:DNA-binding response OmpR family regulator